MGTIAARLDAVRKRIDQACRDAGRDPADVRLLPVSKTQGVDRIEEAYAAGVRIFGENKAQEVAEKAALLAGRPDLSWAVIGHLQTNKAKVVAQYATEFHALDSARVAEALDRRLNNAGRALDVFLQVNSSGEESKHGLDPADVEQFAKSMRQYRSLRVRGLMTLAVLSDDQDAVRRCFERMQQLQIRLQNADQAAGSYAELSMGMSGDFELAIAHGATTVRVGQAIFGSRSEPDEYWST
ncbi:MAG TPA: YggS family pyridoxal phosphate-dependent enzyme [Propionibacteriaceae bacterium]|nr:YggS family pyridoxal phosphate-dependent enzyme [Propionibacteriaceae bacterium]